MGVFCVTFPVSCHCDLLLVSRIFCPCSKGTAVQVMFRSSLAQSKVFRLHLVFCVCIADKFVGKHRVSLCLHLMAPGKEIPEGFFFLYYGDLCSGEGFSTGLSIGD